MQRCWGEKAIGCWQNYIWRRWKDLRLDFFAESYQVDKRLQTWERSLITVIEGWSPKVGEGNKHSRYEGARWFADSLLRRLCQFLAPVCALSLGRQWIASLYSNREAIHLNEGVTLVQQVRISGHENRGHRKERNQDSGIDGGEDVSSTWLPNTWRLQAMWRSTQVCRIQSAYLDTDETR